MHKLGIRILLSTKSHSRTLVHSRMAARQDRSRPRGRCPDVPLHILRRNDVQGPATRRAPLVACQGLDGRGRAVACAWDRRQHRALQRGQWDVADLRAGQGSRHAGAVEVRWPQRHGDELERLRVSEQDCGRTRRPRLFLVPDVSAVRRRQPDHVGPVRVRTVRAGQPRRRQPGGNRDRVHLLGQLLPRARRHGAPRPDDPARRRHADGSSGRGHQLQILALALRHRSGHRGEDGQDQQRPRDDRRRHLTAVHRRPATARQPARHHRPARARPAAQYRPGDRAAAFEPTDLLVAAGHGTSEARFHRGPGTREPRRGLPADSAERARLVPEVALR